MTSPFISQDVYLNNIGLDGIISSPGGSSVFPSGIVVHVTGTNYTYQTFNNGDTIRRTNGGVAMFDTLPEAKTNIYYPNGWVVWVENSDTVSLTITPVVSTINGLTSLVLSPEQTARIISDGLNYYAFVTTSSSSIVTSIEGLTGAVILSAGTGISIPAPSGQIITIGNTGVTGIEANTSGTLHTGSINFINGTNTTIVDNGSGVFQINTTTGAGGVSSINTTAVGGVTITSTTGVSVGTAGSTITLGNTGVTAVEANTSGTLRTGTINFINGTNTTVVDNGGGSFQINVPSGAGGVTTFNSSTGTITLVSGTNTTVVANGGGSFQTNVATGNSITTVSSALEVSSPINLQVVASYTYLTTDRGKTVNRSNSGAAMTDTLPQAGTSFPNGWFVIVQNVDVTTANAITTFPANIIITPTTSTINGNTSLTVPIGQAVRIVSDGTNYKGFTYQLYGNTQNPIFSPNGVIVQPGGLSVINQELYGWGNCAAVVSINANGFGGNIAQVSGGFATPSTGLSSYFSRDFVGMIAGIYDRPRRYPNTFTSSYTTTSVTLTAPVSTSGLAVNMVIDTNDSLKYSGMITSWGSGSTTSTINVSGWYQVAGWYLSAAALVSGGTGYVAGNVLTLIGGSGQSWNAQITVNTVSSGVIATFTVTYAGSYDNTNGGLPTSTSVLTVTGGAGTGATFTGTFTHVAGNSSAGQVPSGNQIDINPNTKIWSVNTVATYQGNGEASQAVGYELDIDNNSGVDDNYQALWGFDSVNLGANKVYTTFIARGRAWIGYTAGLNGITTGSTAGFCYNSYDGNAGAGFLTYQTNGYAIQCMPGNSTVLQGTSFAVTAATGQIDIGSFGKSGVASAPTINFHSASQAVSGTYNAYDAQIQVLGGTDGTPGRGTIMYTAANHEFMKGGGANYINIVPSLTTVAPTIAAQGTDTNVTLVLKAQAAGLVTLQSNNATALIVSNPTSAVNVLFMSGSATGNPTIIHNGGSDTNIPMTIYTTGAGAINLNPGSTVGLTVSATASSVNYLNVIPGAAGSGVQVYSAGGDASVNLLLGTPGGGSVSLQPRGLNALVATSASSAVNYIAVGSANTTVSPIISAIGSDTNVNMTLNAQGTGTIIMESGGTNTFIFSTGVIQMLNTSAGGTILGPNGGSLVVESAANGTTAYPLILRTPANTTAGGGSQVPRLTLNAGVASGSAGIATAETIYFSANTTGYAYASQACIAATASAGSLILNSPTGNTVQTQVNGLNGLVVQGVASSVNYVGIVPAITTSAPAIFAVGSDTNINLVLKSQGTGNVILQSTGGTGLSVVGSSTVTTFLTVTPSAASSTDLLIGTGGSSNNNVRINPTTGSVKIGTGGLLAVGAITGFVMVPSVNGAPTGAPTGAGAGDIPHVVDTVDGKAWWYYGSAWHYAALT